MSSVSCAAAASLRRSAPPSGRCEISALSEIRSSACGPDRWPCALPSDMRHCCEPRYDPSHSHLPPPGGALRRAAARALRGRIGRCRHGRGRLPACPAGGGNPRRATVSSGDPGRAARIAVGPGDGGRRRVPRARRRPDRRPPRHQCPGRAPRHHRRLCVRGDAGAAVGPAGPTAGSGGETLESAPHAGARRSDGRHRRPRGHRPGDRPQSRRLRHEGARGPQEQRGRARCCEGLSSGRAARMPRA